MHQFNDTCAGVFPLPPRRVSRISANETGRSGEVREGEGGGFTSLHPLARSLPRLHPRPPLEAPGSPSSGNWPPSPPRRLDLRSVRARVLSLPLSEAPGPKETARFDSESAKSRAGTAPPPRTFLGIFCSRGAALAVVTGREISTAPSGPRAQPEPGAPSATPASGEGEGGGLARMTL